MRADSTTEAILLMKCPNCNEVVYRTDDRCISCGYDLIPPKRRSPPTTPRDDSDARVTPRAVLWQLAKTLLLLLMIVVLWLDPFAMAAPYVEELVGERVILVVRMLGVALALYLIGRRVLARLVGRLLRDPSENIIDAMRESPLRFHNEDDGGWDEEADKD